MVRKAPRKAEGGQEQTAITESPLRCLGSNFEPSPLIRPSRYTGDRMRWCTVTVTDAEGRRHSVDLQARGCLTPLTCSWVVKSEQQVGAPKPTLATVFELVTCGKVTEPPYSAGLWRRGDR